MPSLTLGPNSGNRVLIHVQRSPHADAWLAASVRVCAGGFSGSFAAMLETHDFSRFRLQLQQLYEHLEGVAVFDTLEDQLIECQGNGRGGIRVRGTATDQPGIGNQLQFEFQIDQTFLPLVIANLKQIETELNCSETS